MRYLCLIYGDPEAVLSPADSEAHIQEHLAFDEGLRRNGHYVTSDALERQEKSTIVRMRDGKVSATDGPFCETKEQLGGFVLIEARDLNEAIQIAAQIPTARLGAVEVRTVRDLTSREGAGQ
jgi:hypothetical protein